ncbi:CTP synthetase [Candidatus Woesearchaeota archaeon CG1_02_33_12]|nr:MAG: CTP synthetase [Candidatus Woesearchaeota archaeon CG1_02_33_12]PIN79243.1 MAG: CTP synthetase [Candidatus Woesearchaeota archaeon CG10_big_fil_rev_8_21_14_0_10_33_12]
MPQFIVVSGGVISGVGKGVTVASIGKILQEYGFSVTAIKIDPYINYDAGTLRPTEHGEVWVTYDGGEIDQDLGNYERFLNMDIPKKNNLTTGQIYKKIIDDERAGKYLGKTVQFIPHIPDEIKRRIKDASDGYDFCIIEVGGTIGDYENIPFLFAMKSIERDIGKENMIYILVTYLPIPSHIDEMKTKPTQQAIRMLGENGIFADFIICRAKKELDNVRKKKIEIYANIRSDHIISEPDIDTIYRIPLDLEKDKMGMKILNEFKIIPRKNPDWTEWKNLVNNVTNSGKDVTIAMVCKYINIGDYGLKDSYVSVNQALQHAGANLGFSVKIKWIDSKKFEEDENALNELKNYDGIIVPGGFGASGVEGKIKAIGFARKNNIPFLGLCYGMQLAIVEFARNVCNMKDANTTEVDEKTEYPVIKILESQKDLIKDQKYGGTMRLGAYAAILDENSIVFELYRKLGRLETDAERIKEIKKESNQLFRLGVLNENNKVIIERHRHRYEVNPDFTKQIQDKGLIFSGYHLRTDGTKLMEFIELPNHKFFIATQSHPEFKSSLNKPSPLFFGFVKSCIK